MGLASLFPGQRPGVRRSRPGRGHFSQRRPRPRYVTRLEALARISHRRSLTE